MSSSEDAADDTPYESDDYDEDSGVDEARSNYSDDRTHSRSGSASPVSSSISFFSNLPSGRPTRPELNVAQVVGYARPVSDSPPLPPSGGSWSDNSDSPVDIPRQSRPARHSGRVDPAYSTRTAARRNPGTNPRRVPQDQADGIPDLSEQVTILRRYAGNTGTYSTVYRGTYRGHEVAIKVVRGGRNSQSSRRQFRRELETWWHTNHPNILKLYGFAEGDEFGQFGAMISPWCRFGSADVLIQQGLRPIQGLNWFRDVAEGLRYLHLFTPIVVHGDLKPANILIDSDYTAKISDFGLVRLIHDGATSGLTTTTAFTGTPRYYSYELVVADNPLPTTASDIHALGCVGMELIYSYSPYGHIPSNYHNATYKICDEISKGIPPASRPAQVTLPISGLWDLFEACWKYYPRDRPSADQVCQYLETHGQSFAQALMT